MKIIIEIDDELVDELDKFETLKYYLTEGKEFMYCGFQKLYNNGGYGSYSCFRENLKNGTIKLRLYKEKFD